MPAIRLSEDEYARISGKKATRPTPSKGVFTQRERGRQTRLNAKRSSEFRVKEASQRSDIKLSASRTLIQEREVIRQRNQQQQRELRTATQKNNARSSAIKGIALKPVDSVANANTASPPSSGGTGHMLITIFGAMAVLIVMYLLVTKTSGTSGFLGALGNWVASVSTTTPLFHTSPGGSSGSPSSEAAPTTSTTSTTNPSGSNAVTTTPTRNVS